MTGCAGVIYKKWVMGAGNKSGGGSGDGMGDGTICWAGDERGKVG